MLFVEHMPTITTFSQVTDPEIFTSSWTRENALIGKDREQLHVDLPARLNGPLAWSGETFGDVEKAVINLTESDVEEIGRAIQGFKGM